MKPTNSCFEIVQFSFRSDLELQRQIQYMQQLGRWAGRQPGFCSRQSYHDPRANRWTDVVEWQTAESARAAMERSQNESSLAELMADIDPGTVVIGHFDRLI